jgi:HEAT repeat protein
MESSANDFETLLQRFQRGESISAEGWTVLSALTGEREAAFRLLWASLSTEQRLQLLDALHTAAEESAHLDFTAIWQLALEDSAPRVREAGIAYSADEEGLWLIEPLLRLCREDPEASVRAAAAEALGRFAYLAEVGDLPAWHARQIQDTLLATVARPDEALPVRANALASAGYFSTPQVQETIRTSHRDPALRQSAVRAMGHNCDPAWLDTLLAETQSPDAALRAEAARALGELEDARGVSRLTELLEDPTLEVQLAAIWALGAIGGQEAQEALIYCLEDPCEAVREAAEAALGELADWNEPLAF